MEPDAVSEQSGETSGEVMASVEDGTERRLILADVTRDDAYLTLPLDEAAALPAWR